MLIRNDTIAALSSPPGRGAIALIRISGPDAHSVCARLARPWPAIPRQVTLCRLHDPGDDSPIDQALITRFDAPRSYTGEAMVELACHGGIAVSAALLEALMHLGARLAEPGEFTQRAVVAGKLDLFQAEAIADLVDARTGALRKLALAQLDGGLSRALNALRDRVLRVEALLAYDLDFPEEDDGPIARQVIVDAVCEAITSIERLLATIPLGDVARDGAMVVIAGAPNAGKSSLFNALLGESRSIVTEIPGTTRDAVEARMESVRWPLRLIDTAGLRETNDIVERLGIEVSERHLHNAHVVLVCGDSPEALQDAVARTESLGHVPRIAVYTKSDLRASPVFARSTTRNNEFMERLGPLESFVEVSATELSGLNELLEEIHQILEKSVGIVQPDFPVLTRARHRYSLQTARDELIQFCRAWHKDGTPAVVAAVHVRSACHALDELIGSVDVEDVLEQVFQTFCVGK